MYENVTRDLATFVTEVKYEDLPTDVVAKTKLLLLDSIGCALGGYVTERAKIALEFVAEMGGNPQASIIGSQRTSYDLAAFANGELINALDYDALGPMVSHVTPYVVPPCLVIAERQYSSGKDLILALALAHEIGGRIVSTMAQQKILIDKPPYYEEPKRFSTGSVVFGVVSGISKLLDFDVETLTNAFGIAGASTAVPANIKWHHMGGPSSMLKYGCWTGWVAQLGTVAALLAEKGFTGDRTILDGEYGYWQMVGSPFFKLENLFNGLGEVWRITEAKFKLYPTCAVFHTAIEGIANLVRENDIHPEDIDEIVIKGDKIIESANRMGTEIKGFADTQFSFVFNMALAAFYGDRPSPAWALPNTYHDPRIHQLMSRVRFELHPQNAEFIAALIKAGKLPIFMGNIVEITAKRKKFTTEIVAPRGSLDRPATEEEILEKFRVNAAYSMLRDSKVKGIIRTVKGLGKVANIAELSQYLVVGEVT